MTTSSSGTQKGKTTEGNVSRWYYAQDGQAVGPLPLLSVQTLVRAGQLPTDVLVVREGGDQWQPLSAIVQQCLGLGMEACPSTLSSSDDQVANGLVFRQTEHSLRQRIAQALLLTALLLVGLWFFVAKVDEPKLAAREQSKAIEQSKGNEHNVPPPGIARDSAPSPVVRKASNYHILDADGSYRISDDGGQLIGHLVDFLNLGTVSEERAANYLFTEKAAPCFVSKVLVEFVICEAPRFYDGTQHVEFAFRRRDVGLEHLPILEFQGYAHYCGQKQFTTQTGVVKSLPVFEVIKDVN